jgi:hypothetical protein
LALLAFLFPIVHIDTAGGEGFNGFNLLFGKSSYGIKVQNFLGAFLFLAVPAALLAVSIMSMKKAFEASKMLIFGAGAFLVQIISHILLSNKKMLIHINEKEYEDMFGDLGGFGGLLDSAMDSALSLIDISASFGMYWNYIVYLAFIALAFLMKKDEKSYDTI